MHSVELAQSSDHKPVFAAFSMKARLGPKDIKVPRQLLRVAHDYSTGSKTKPARLRGPHFMKFIFSELKVLKYLIKRSLLVC